MTFLQKNALSLTLLAGLLSSAPLQAQSIQIDLDTKVIHTDSLNLPRQTNVHTMLTMMPELLQRPNDVVFSNYDIQVNGLSVNGACETALYQLDLEDIEKVEIVEAATSSYLKNGQGGIINIILRKKSQEDSRTWGSASVQLSLPKSVSPQFTLGYNTKKMYLAALILSDTYANTTSSENLSFQNNLLQSRSTSTDTERFGSQIANVMIDYNLTSRDLIKFKLAEAFTYEKHTLADDHDAVSKARTKEKSTTLNAVASYKHTFNRSSAVLEVNYRYNPITASDFTPEVVDIQKEHDVNTLAGKLEYTADVLDQNNHQHHMKLGVGSLYNFTFGDDEIEYTDLRNSHSSPTSLLPENDTYFLQPYAFLEAKFGKFKMKAEADFQHFRYKMHQDNKSFDVTSNDLTGKLIFEWHMSHDRMIRLLGNRELQRPANTQLFPIMQFNPSGMKYIQGNPNLTPALTHEISLDFSSNQKWDEHSLHYDLNVSYKHVGDMIESVTEGGSATGGLGTSMQYNTFANHGKSDIVSGNFMAMYSHQAFTLTLTANVFNNKQSTFSGSDHYTYYNISLNPHFTLKDSWQGSFNLIYNSSVDTRSGKLSDCTQVGTLLGKRWKNLYAYFFCKMALDKNAKDVSKQGNIRNEHLYEMISNTAGFTVKYLF